MACISFVGLEEMLKPMTIVYWYKFCLTACANCNDLGHLAVYVSCVAGSKHADQLLRYCKHISVVSIFHSLMKMTHWHILILVLMIYHGCR